MKEEKITREILYNLVWSEPLSSIIKKYYISENGLRKKCTELKIPIPNLGYWASLKHGKNAPDKIPLKEFNGYSTFYLKIREEVEQMKESAQNHLSRLREEIEKDTKVKLKVPSNLTNPDPIIALAKDRMYKKDIWQDDKTIINSPHGSLNLMVSPKHLNRALRFMDTMIKALRNRGHEFIKKNGEVYVDIFGKEYPISCKEKSKRIKVKDKYGESTAYENTGILSFRLGESYWIKEWTEGQTPIEEQVLKILVGIEYHGWKEQEERIYYEKIRIENKEKERIAKELQNRKEKELANFMELFRKSQRHEKAEIIRRYIYTLEQFAIKRNELTEDLKEEIEWSRRKADWYDPFIESYDELLNEVNRDDLVLKKQGFMWL